MPQERSRQQTSQEHTPEQLAIIFGVAVRETLDKLAEDLAVFWGACKLEGGAQELRQALWQYQVGTIDRLKTITANAPSNPLHSLTTDEQRKQFFDRMALKVALMMTAEAAKAMRVALEDMPNVAEIETNLRPEA